MIYYQKGDATKPEMKENAQNYIIHCCNNKNRWGAGFVLAINKAFGDDPRQTYLHASQELGTISIVKVGPNLHVINMIGQHDTVPIEGISPVRYPALVKAMKEVNKTIPDNSRIHFPLFGAGLAGGCWDTIEILINGIFGKNFELYGYVFPTDTQYMYLIQRQKILERIARNPEIINDLFKRLDEPIVD